MTRVDLEKNTETETISPIKKELAEGLLFKRQKKHEMTREASDDKRSIKGQEKYGTTRADPDKNTDKKELAH